MHESFLEIFRGFHIMMPSFTFLLLQIFSWLSEGQNLALYLPWNVIA